MWLDEIGWGRSAAKMPPHVSGAAASTNKWNKSFLFGRAVPVITVLNRQEEVEAEFYCSVKYGIKKRKVAPKFEEKKVLGVNPNGQL